MKQRAEFYQASITVVVRVVAIEAAESARLFVPEGLGLSFPVRFAM